MWAAAASDRVATGVVPGAVAAASFLAAYAAWRARGRRWHDLAVVALLAPALASGLWLAIGGTVLDVARSDAGRLGVEVGPGLALTGLACAAAGYQARHHPAEG